jgi:hypothetical protein
MHDLVLLYCEREYIIWVNNKEALEKLENNVRLGLFHKKDLSSFWDQIRILIVEKLSKEILVTHTKVIDTQV